MKKKICRLIAILSVIVWSSFAPINFDHLTEKKRECIVVDKMTQSGRITSYIMILKYEGILFSHNVGPVSFSQFDINEKIILDIRDYDINPDMIKFCYCVISSSILSVIGLVILLTSLFKFTTYLLYKD